MYWRAVFAWSSNRRNFPLTEVGKFRLRACKIWQNLTKFDKLAIKFLNDSFPDYILDCSKFCQILSNFFEWLSNFYINLVKFFQMLSDSILFSNGRFELQMITAGTDPQISSRSDCYKYTTIQKALELNPVTYKNWSSKCRNWPLTDYVKIWWWWCKNLTEFNKI